MSNTYKLVLWPESQDFMEHERFNECILGMELEGHDEIGLSAYFIPVDLYNEVYKVSDLEYIELLREAYKAGLKLVTDTTGDVTKYFDEWFKNYRNETA